MRCEAAHVEDPSACSGPVDEVRIVDRAGTSTPACVRHGAVLLASLVGGRVYVGSREGAALEVYNRARSLGPFSFDHH